MPRANNNNKKNRKRRTSSNSTPLHIEDDVIASRTRRQKKAIASKWDIQTPIIIEIISWINQDDLMNLSLVSKQLHNIIRNEPGNKNKIIPVFEVRVSSFLKLFQNLSRHLLDKKTKKKLQSYRIMVVNNVERFAPNSEEIDQVQQIAKNVQMNGITSLYFSLSSGGGQSIDRNLYLLSKISPGLCEVDFSDISVTNSILEEFLDGHCMRFSNNLKEIIIDNACFFCERFVINGISNLNNNQEIFLFHKCCKAIERVSIRNAGFAYSQIGKLIQKILIKFVRNAPPTLRWFRSDLTTENMTMLRLERPGIELLN
jgi:hypothetical protein